MELKELFQKFIKECEYIKNLSPQTIRSYKYSFDAWERFHGELSEDGLTDFIFDMREAGLKPGACNVYIRSLNVFFSWLHAKKHTEEHYKLTQVKKTEDIIPIFTDDDVRKILRFQPKSFNEWRLWTVCHVLLDTGLRISEVLPLRVDNVDYQDLLITVRTKGGNQRRVPFSMELRKVLYQFHKMRDISNPTGSVLFPTYNGTEILYRNFHRDLVNFCRRLKISGARVSPHSFRHFFSVNFIKEGGDIYTLCKLLNHSSVTVTEIYLKSLGLEHLQKTQSRFTPLNKR